MTSEDYQKNIGKRCTKTDGRKAAKPFKSGYKINTIKGVTMHPVLSIPAYTILFSVLSHKAK